VARSVLIRMDISYESVFCDNSTVRPGAVLQLLVLLLQLAIRNAICGSAPELVQQLHCDTAGVTRLRLEAVAG